MVQRLEGSEAGEERLLEKESNDQVVQVLYRPRSLDFLNGSGGLRSAR